MELTSLATVILTGVLALVVLIAAAAWLPRTRRTTRGFLARVATLVGTSLATLVFVFTLLNNQNGWYASWADLLGNAGAQDAPAQTAGGKAGDLFTKAASHNAGAPLTRPALPQPGERVQRYTMTGATSGLTGTVIVILPVGYEDPANANRTYPVILANHGSPGIPDVYATGFNLIRQTDDALAAKKLGPVIVVSPQLEYPRGTDTECTNGAPGKPQVETFVAQDVPQWAIAQLRVAEDRASWATFGFSSGGYCAAMEAMLHPDRFGGAIVLGGYFQPQFAGSVPYGSAAGKRYDLEALAAASPPAVALWVQTGSQDGTSWFSTNRLFAAAKAPLAITQVVNKGAGHRMDVWVGYAPTALAWLGSTVPGFKP